MTIYDVLRKLLVGGNWTAEEKQAAVKLIDDLEAVNAFGTSAAQTTREEEPAT